MAVAGVENQRFLIYACNASNENDTDPITTTIVAMLSSPVHISLSNIGVRAFKNTSLPPLPYYLMDSAQVSTACKKCVVCVCCAVREQTDDAHVRGTNHPPPPSATSYGI